MAKTRGEIRKNWVSRYEGQFKEISRRWYAASVTHMDEGVERIVAALERSGKREDTLLAFKLTIHRRTQIFESIVAEKYDNRA